MRVDGRAARAETAEPPQPAWGRSTEQALEVFLVSGQPMPVRFLAALVLVKLCAAEANQDLGLLEEAKAGAIVAAAEELLEGKSWAQFPLDIYQTGSGTSTNMNCNEVVAALTEKYLPAGLAVHPNDDVNLGQSSNDVVPTAMQVSAAVALRDLLLPALADLTHALSAKRDEFWPVIKLARTHLQDATPIRLGQEMHGYVGQAQACTRLVERAIDDLRVVPLGGTAVGTGINTHPEFARRTCQRLSGRLGLEVTEATNHFSAQSTLDVAIAAHGAIKTAALSLWKVASDLRLLSSGPRAGLGELVIPDVGVTSSIMPTKSPPAVIESLTMAVARVVGNDAAICFAQTGSLLELNVMMPVTIAALLESVELLSAATTNFARRCVAGLQATGQGPVNAAKGVMLATALSPFVGYDEAGLIAREALQRDETVQVVARRRGLPEELLIAILDPAALTEPHANPAPSPPGRASQPSPRGSVDGDGWARPKTKSAKAKTRSGPQGRPQP